MMNIPFTLTLVCEERISAANHWIDYLMAQVQQELQVIDHIFSPFKQDSLLKKYQAGDLQIMQNASFHTVFDLAKRAAKTTTGFFDPYYASEFNPTGLVKGWAIEKIFNNLLSPFLTSHPQVTGISLNGGGDLQFATQPESSFDWEIGIENPKQLHSLSAVYKLKNGAAATSGFSKRGQHISNLTDHSLLQATIISEGLTWADIWATTALAAGQQKFINLLTEHQLTGLMITSKTIIPFSEGRLADAEKNTI
ncbi:FAD:protein FMN transferase [Liquorilactobacillus mali]|uniref:FAD:protein FMN transferase n=1 Tax=Liquorilactobacillus mali KCTC 3596 = DSM 20444 TaxID=1046596 RepID=A0A0R2DYX2_9LACO|nr:FAD:protein FMN transferase [Liquorilactobacillus mali]KRN09096.1 thiamine biosynthesis membrane-associated lipoprotein [Liquorilactobacillus mali KCTC 3596 = DSM 20444]QFQ74410.1 FAD:protein FMN transferase [Liquorilactobacillus mali]